jgi:alpha-tubulin suppressor-like RCC1 family protein
MKRARVAAAALLWLLAGCSREIVVFDPHGLGDAAFEPMPAGDAAPELDGAPPTFDGGLDDGQLADAALDATTSDGGPNATEPDDAMARDGGTVILPDASVGPPASGVATVSAFAHSCALRDGGVYCWGGNEAGQVGTEDAAVLRPALIIASGIRDVCTGEQHSCALASSGALSCWGRNTHGELGLGDRVPRARPTAIAGRSFAAIACGGNSTCALVDGGALFCWGDNLEGKLGQGGADDANGLAPVAVAPELRFSRVSVGQGHVCAITIEGALYCWGRNTEGQLGVPEPLIQARAPLPVAAETRFSRVAAAMEHTCAVDVMGRLFCWGDNRGRLLGRPEPAILRTPGQVGTESDFADVSVNWFHSCARKRGGALYCWGRNEEGQLGLGDTIPRPTLTRVGSESDWSAMAVGQFHTCGLRTSSLYCWGDNRAGQLGLGDDARRYVPIGVPIP